MSGRARVATRRPARRALATTLLVLGMGRALASFYAAGVTTHAYLWTDCVRGQSVGELSAWLRNTAPAELTLQEALRLNAREHGCEARDKEDLDAELAIRAGRRR